MATVYALKCLATNCPIPRWYIGRTTNVHKRFNEHKNGHGSAWTKIYKPLEIIEQLHNSDEFDEDKMTVKYMSRHGINNVRGGSFSSIELHEHQIKTLETMIRNAEGSCFLCGEKGHFATRCHNSMSMSTSRLSLIRNTDRNPLNHYKKWSKIEDEQLLLHIKDGKSYREIAPLLGRTTFAVFCRHQNKMQQ